MSFNRPRKKTILFACRHNAGRSQMAAAYFNRHADSKIAVAISAGTEPADRIHPEVLATMKEVGINLSKKIPTLLTENVAKETDLLVTMGCGDNCPFLPGLKVEDWKLEDPKGKAADEVRLIRNKIRVLVLSLLSSNDWIKK